MATLWQDTELATPAAKLVQCYYLISSSLPHQLNGGYEHCERKDIGIQAQHSKVIRR